MPGTIWDEEVWNTSQPQADEQSAPIPSQEPSSTQPASVWDASKWQSPDAETDNSQPAPAPAETSVWDASKWQPPTQAPAPVESQQPAEQSVYDTMRANQAKLAGQLGRAPTDYETYRQNLTGSPDAPSLGEITASAVKEIPDTLPVRTVEQAGANLVGNVGNIMLTVPHEVISHVGSLIGRDWSNSPPKQIRDALNGGLRAYAQHQEDLDKQGMLGESLTGAIRQAGGMVGEMALLPEAKVAEGAGALASLVTKAAPLVGYMTASGTAHSLADSDENKITGPAKYISGAITGAIDGASALAMVAFGSGLGKLASGESQGVIQQAVQALTDKYSLSAPISKAVAAAGEGGSQVGFNIGTNIAHYLNDAAFGKRKWSKDELAKAVEQGNLTAAIAGAAGGLLHPHIPKAQLNDIVDTIDNRIQELPEAIKQAKQEPAVGMEVSGQGTETEVPIGSVEPQPSDSQSTPKLASLPESEQHLIVQNYLNGDLHSLNTERHNAGLEPYDPKEVEGLFRRTKDDNGEDSYELTKTLPNAPPPPPPVNAPPPLQSPDSASPSSEPAAASNLTDVQVPDWLPENDLTRRLNGEAEDNAQEAAGIAHPPGGASFETAKTADQLDRDAAPPESPKPTEKERTGLRKEINQIRRREILPQSTLDDLTALDHQDQRDIIDSAKQLAAVHNEYMATLRQQYRDVYGSGKARGLASARAAKDAARGADETSVKRYDQVAEDLRQPQYAELAAETDKAGGILSTDAGGAKQFADIPHDEYIGDILRRHQDAKDRASREARSASENLGASQERPVNAASGGESGVPRPEEVPPQQSPEQVAPTTSAELSSQIEAAATSPEEAGALNSLVNAFAEYRGETPDEFVGKHIAGVEKGPESESRYLKQNAEPAPGTIGPDGEVLRQGESSGKKRAVRGETQFLSDGRAIIRAFQENQNIATLAHELGHVFRRSLLPEELSKTEKALGVEGGKWKRENEERFARMFERYLREGKAPTKTLRAVFEKFKNWLTSVYQNLAKSPLAKDIPPQLREVFDTMLGAKGESPPTATEVNGPETLAQPGGTTGIAHRVEEARRDSLGQAAPQRGQGIASADSVARGRALLAQGQSPQNAVADFQQTGAISSDGIALVRAKHEELAQAAHKALDAAGQNENDPAFKAAEKARQDWWQNAVKPMQTEWHRAGMAQQGETDIDTGSFYGLQRAFQEQTGKELKPAQAKEAKRKAADVAAKTEDVDAVNQKLLEIINGGSPVDESVREDAHQNLVAEVDAGPKKYAPVVIKWAEKFTSWLDKHADSALSRFRKNHSNSTLDLSDDVLAQDETPLDSEDINDLTVFTAAKIARGLTDKAKWEDMMRIHVGDVAEPHLNDIWNAAHKTLETNLKEFVKDKPTAKRVRKALEDPKNALPSQIATAASPDMTPRQLAINAKDVSRAFIRQGVREREANVDAVHAELSKHIPGLSRENTADAMSGYGDYRQLNKEDPAEVRRREIAGEVQQTRKLQDMTAKKIPKVSGVERQEPTAEYRRLTKQVNEAKRKAAEEGWYKAASDRQAKSALDAMKTRAENRITDLVNELAKGEKAVKDRKSPPTSPELDALREELASIKGWHDNIFGKESRKLTDEQRLDAATKATEKTLRDLERRVAEKDFTEKKLSPISSPELDAMRARVQEQRANLAELRSLDPAAARSDAEKRDASWLRQLATQNAKLADQIAAKDFTKNGAKSRVTFNPDVKAASEQNAGLREQANAASALQTVQGHDAAAKWTQDEVASLWKMAKSNYTDKGVANFKDIAKGLSVDTGLPADVIMRGLGQLKGARAVTNELYAKQSARRRADAAAKRWLVDADTPRTLKTLKAIPGGLFAMKIGAGLHGTVGMVTHAIPSAFSIPGSAQWRAYFRNFGKQFPLSFSRAYHEREMQALTLRDNYLTAQRAGLKTNPDATYGEYELAAKLIGKLGLPSGNGFDSLKIMRQDLFDLAWNKLPDSLKTPDMAKRVALTANHLTGAGENIGGTGVAGKVADVAMFAPRLEGARWGLAIGDPAVMAKQFLNWKNEPPEARAHALSTLKQTATMAGVYLSYLAVNQAMLSASNSDDKINFTDPTKSDWLSFKVAGRNIGVIGPLLTPFRLMANAVADLHNGTAGAVKQLRGKLSPFGKVVTDTAVGSDFSNRPLPWSSNKVPKSMADKGIGPLSYGEYITETFLPIPLEDAIKEVWNDQGIAANKAEDYLKAIEAGAAGMIGVNVRDIPPPKPVKVGKPVKPPKLTTFGRPKPKGR